MNSRQKNSFSGFLYAFIALIAVAYGVLIWAGLQEEHGVAPVDNVAVPN
jgi:hypothetical protein